MNKILKIVGGPLRGSEIALVAGTKVSVGCGEKCDILVADPTLGDVAFELEVTDEDVTITFPDGTAKAMLDFEAREVGASAFAVGPSEGEWQEIVWPEREKPSDAAAETEAGAASKPPDEPVGEAPPKVDPLKQQEPGADAEKKPERRGHAGCVVSIIVLLILLVGLLILVWWQRELVTETWNRHRWPREFVTETWNRWFPDREAEAARLAAARPKLSDIAAKHGLTLTENAGRPVLSGNFLTRQERLRATAEAYMAAPGTEIDLTDDESLLVAAEDLLRLVTDGRITVEAATNRVVVLKGNAASADALHDILVALNEDVPGIARADCRKVVCGSGKSEEEYGDDMPDLPGITRPPRKMKRSSVSPNLPICGILTTPYPCLIMKNGMRIIEGGEFGGCIVERITADAVTLRNNSGSFEWRP